jgi:hypothetical protein
MRKNTEYFSQHVNKNTLRSRNILIYNTNPTQFIPKKIPFHFSLKWDSLFVKLLRLRPAAEFGFE